MKQIILIKFLILSILTFSFTREEKIQNSLQKLGINQEIIDETIKADYDAREIVAFQTDEVVIGQMLQRFSNILKKDERNYIASENIITIYESKIGKDYKNYLDLFVKYTPYDFEKTFAKMVYERSYGSQKKYDKYYSQLKEKYKNRIPDNFLPISSNEFGDLICLCTQGERIGQIFYWDHENEWDEEDYFDEFGVQMPEEVKFQNIYLIGKNLYDCFSRMIPV